MSISDVSELPSEARAIYAAERAFRWRTKPFTNADAAEDLFQQILYDHHVPQAHNAFVIRRHDGKFSAVVWDNGTNPRTPGAVLAPGMEDRITIIHEAAHIIEQNDLLTPFKNVGEAHGATFVEIYLQLLTEYEPDLVKDFETDLRTYQRQYAEVETAVAADKPASRETDRTL